MSCINIIGKMVKADEEKSEIKRKLEEIRKIRTSFNIDVSRFRKMIDRDKLNQVEIERDNEKYKIIAKLSFDLFMDYEYYREFPIKNDSRFTNCAEELESLGYELRESAEWVNVRRPNIGTIIDQIFLSHLCQSILTRCVCCDAITRDGQSECDNCLNESNEKRINVIIEKDNNDIDNRKFESLISLNRSICDNYSNCVNGNKIMADKCTNCYNCGSDKEIIGEEMCGDCFNARWSDWICPYEFCGKSNNSNAEYCELCGIERSQTSITRAPLWRKQNGILYQIWVCEKCKIINEIDKFKHCQVCDVPMDKSSEKIANQDESKRTEERINSRNSSDKVNNKSNIYQENKRDSMICKKCKDVKTILDEDMCTDCFNARWSDWICPYESCKSINTESDKYCKSCGIKRSPVLIVDTPIERWKNARLIKVWICGRCHHLNENIKNKMCGHCLKSMNKSSNQTENHSKNDREFVLVENKNTMEYQENNQSNIDQKSQWKCEGCELINDVAFLSCRRCNWARAIIWTCSRCSKENEESVQQCGACGFTNENAEKKFCVRCRQKESIMNGLCAQCLNDRNLDWRCLYRNCGRINSFKDDYCRDCGLHRYIFWKHGAPNWRLKNGYPERIWICFYCWTINKWSDERCTKYYLYCLAERDKFFKWCKSCWSQNGRSEIKCSRCKQWL